MGTLIIIGTDYSYERNSILNSTPGGSADLPTQPVVQSIQNLNVDFTYYRSLIENSTPPGSADIEKQPVLSIIQAKGFDFIYHVLPAGFADSYTVHTHTKTSIDVAGTPFAGLDLSNKAVIITSGTLNGYFFYITAYDDNTVKGSGIDLTSLVDDTDTFIIHSPALPLEQNPTPPASADLPKQDILQNLQHWSEDFFFVFVIVNEKTFYIHVQDKAKKTLDNAAITVTDLDHPLIPPETLYTNIEGNVTYVATLLSRYKFEVSRKNYLPFSFELGMLTSQPAIKGIRTLLQDFKSIIVTEEEKKAVEEKAISQQSIEQNLQTLLQDFNYVLVLIENDEPVKEKP